MPEDEPGAGGHASAYSTGGGGVILEHAYGGALLAELLLGGPVSGLGSDVTPVRIGFQQSAHSPVDDLTVTGEGPGGRRTLFIGVRRRPVVGASQKPFVKLTASYLRVISEHEAELEAGSRRLGLAVQAPHTPTGEVAALASFARLQPDAARFRSAVRAPRATTAAVRSRLGNIDDVVAAAAREAGIAAAGDDLSWRLLRYLRVLDLRLEGDDAAGRTSLVARLVPLAGDAAAADDLRRRLCELSAGYAVGAAAVTEEMLRRDLSGLTRVAASPARQASWDVLAELEDSLSSRTPRYLAGGRRSAAAGTGPLTLDRADVRAALVTAMTAAGRTAGQLVVHGEPDAGKSAAVLSAAEEVRRDGGTVVTLSLRDLPAASGLAAARLLRAAPRALFAATAAAPVRLVVLDGAEAAQESGPGLLRDLARAAWQAGLGLVAVTRDDARETVTAALAAARDAEPGGAPPVLAEAEVPPLTDGEVSQVRQAFAGLGRLAADERSAWLLRRVGIIDSLLRGDAVASLPDGSLSEADVVDAVWHAWVRNREQPLPDGATADGRDETMTGLARRHLSGGGGAGAALTADPRALASLRMDGLLLPAGPGFAFRRGEEFSSDTVRDFALAVLFAREGFGALRQAGAPRWALRAARMACQGLLAVPGHPPGRPAAGRMPDLLREFDAIAAEYGGRWAELPWEAALTTGAAETILQESAGDLLQPGAAALDRVLRLVSQRFTHAGAADPVIAAPVVAFIVERPAQVEAARYRFAEDAGQLIASWLRSVRRAEMAGGEVGPWRPLRGHVRDYVLRPGRADHEIEAECLALLGADADERAYGCLRRLARDSPHRLAACVELYDPAMSLAASSLDLLFELTEAYYIEDPAAVRYNGWHTMGIRRHKHTHAGFGPPYADMRFGPFWLLVPLAPDRALALVNRMLDRAAGFRARPRRPASPGPGQGEGDGGPRGDRAVPGVELDIPGIGSRHYAGDEHVWAWYRGAGIGPHPCMSALLAVEYCAGQWLEQGTPLPRLIAALLRDAHNLAMPGLVVGLLTRHAEQVSGEADPFLASAGIWELESVRVPMEAGPRAQGRFTPDDPRRSWTMADLAACLVLHAVQRNDQDRLAALRSAGSALTAEAAGDGGEHSAVIRRWASMLDAGNYTAGHDNGNLTWEWTPPAGIEAAIAASRDDAERAGEVFRLINTYGLQAQPPHLACPPAPVPAAALTADARLARDIAGHPPVLEALPADAVTAVAAALLRAAAQQAGAVQRDDLQWAVLVTAAALLHPLDAPGSFEGTVFPRGAGRSAASAAACLLMPALTQPGDGPALLGEEDIAELPQLLAAATASPSTEVRMIFARALGPVWAAPCGPGPSGTSRCRHAIAWAALEAGARDAALGAAEPPTGRRAHRRLDGDLAAALAGCPAGDLLLDHLAPPLIAACDAARTGNCIADAARDARHSLLAAYTRTAAAWGEAGYDQHDEDQYAIAEALLTAGAAEPALLTMFAAGLAGQGRALSENLRAMTVTATYSAACRAVLASTWPAVMTAVLDAADSGAGALSDRHWGEHAIAEMIPSPSPASWDGNADAVISAARDGWPGPRSLASQIERLLPVAAGWWHAADNLIGLLRTAPLTDQARLGLPWIHRIIASRGRNPGLPAWLAVEWLRSLDEARAVSAGTRPLYNAIVDALAAESYPGAVELQRQGEQGRLRARGVTRARLPGPAAGRGSVEELAEALHPVDGQVPAGPHERLQEPAEGRQALRVT
jgi:hypothetical protein